jgi:hypothetical protein
MPVHSSAGISSEAEYMTKWRTWQAECRANQHRFQQDPNLEMLFGVLMGQETVILSLAKKWQEAFVAILLYQNPIAQAFELQ